MTAEIIVVGFPKSGNTWLTRLLSDALDYPVTGIDDAVPLAADQQERKGDGLIRQLHLSPQRNGSGRFVANRFTLDYNQHHGEHVIHILRDPRDVAVAINAYWEIKNLTRVIGEVMRTGAHPLWGCGWEEYVQKWQGGDYAHLETRFTWLHDDPALEIRRLCDLMGMKIVKPLDEVIRRQSLTEKRAEISARDDSACYMPHGKGAQLQNLRGGRVGDWRAAFDEAQRRLAYEVFGSWLVTLGYETNDAWVN